MCVFRIFRKQLFLIALRIVAPCCFIPIFTSSIIWIFFHTSIEETQIKLRLVVVDNSVPVSLEDPWWGSHSVTLFNEVGKHVMEMLTKLLLQISNSWTHHLHIDLGFDREHCHNRFLFSVKSWSVFRIINLNHRTPRLSLMKFSSQANSIHSLRCQTMMLSGARSCRNSFFENVRV